MNASVKISSLIESPVDNRLGDIFISGISLDSRQIKSGDLFIALVGEKFDARQFIDQVIRQGASAVLAEADNNGNIIEWREYVPVIYIENLAQKASGIAAAFYQHPSHYCRLIGVTGTNGKTTCTLLAAQLASYINAEKSVAGVIGTLGYGAVNAFSVAPISQQINSLVSTGLTTPDAVALQKHLRELVNQDAATIAMEVSSIGLVVGRVASLQFDTAIFTNLTQDHLDFHGTMDAYAAAKATLLNFPHLKTAIVNLDDDWASSLKQQCPNSVKAYSYSVENSAADFYLTDLKLTPKGAIAELNTPWGSGEFMSPFLGRFNLSNLLAVIASALVEQPKKLQELLTCLPKLVAAPGRMEPVVVDSQQQDIHVVVDYAHTPDALEKSLTALHDHADAKVWSVFGCGGDRDKTKRPLMGALAEKHSDFVIVTNDNPRSEEPASIVADIIKGFKNPKACLAIADRAQAIDFAIQQAKPGDIVLIAGKGHENYQIIGDQKINFSDVLQARLALQRRIVKRDLAQEGRQ